MMSFARSILAVAISLALSFSAMAKLPIVPGLWEITRKTNIDGANFPEMTDMMKKLPPEAQEQMKKMMEDQGIGKTSKGLKVCITKEEIELEKIPQEEGCDMKVTKRTKNELVYDFKCKKPEGKGTAVVTAKGPKSYQTNIDMEMVEDGKMRKLKMEANGTWLQTDCGEYGKQK